MSLRLPIGQFRSLNYRPSFPSACNRLAQSLNYRPSSLSAYNRLAQFSHAAVTREEKVEDPRLREEVGDLIIEDQYAILREKYGMLRISIHMSFLPLTNHKDTPKNPIILAHGLMGFEGKRY
jgi:triacylglycerol lipase